MARCPQTLLSFLLLPLLAVALPACAQDTAPDAAQVAPTPIVSSPVSGIVFSDAPRILPVDSRFAQAIETIGFDLGLSCGQVESYGWALGATEQDRVNGIFTNAAQELSSLGYAVQPQSPPSATTDLTVYTATRPDRTVLFTWSAGSNGLLLLLCDAQSGVVSQGFGPAPGTVHRPAPAMSLPGMPAPINPQDLVGDWQGTYSCMSQGPAGATLTISRVRPDQTGTAISGSFSFYPLDDKTPDAPHGSYRVSGRLDPESGRAILDPGVWTDRPPGFTSAPLIAEFTPAEQRVSATFQGTVGCTSVEATYKPGSATAAAAKAVAEPMISTDTPRRARPAPRKMKKPVAAVTKPMPPATDDAAPVVVATPEPASVDAPATAAEPVAAAPTADETPAPVAAPDVTVPDVAPVTPVKGEAPAKADTAAPKVDAPVIKTDMTPAKTEATPAKVEAPMTPPTPQPAPQPAVPVLPAQAAATAAVATDKVDVKKPLTVEPLPTDAKKVATPTPVTTTPLAPQDVPPPPPPSAAPATPAQ